MNRMTLLLMLFLASPAAVGDLYAEVAFLRNGRSIEVAGFKVTGDRVILTMTGGGEMTLPATEVLEIRRQPPEVPAVGPPVPGSTAAPDPLPSLPPALDRAAADPGPAPAPPFDGQAGEADTLLPVGGVFDREALRDMAARIARQHGVDASLVHAVIQIESRYNAFAVSPRGAMGLMQLMPKTAARFAVENAFDPVENVDAGVRYLKELLERYSGERRLALSAYNAGEEAVERYSGIPPYRETIDYVGRVLGLLRR